MQINLNAQAAKKMSRKLQEFAKSRGGQCTTSQSYEMLAHLFDVKDWNTLSASLQDKQTSKKQRIDTFIKTIVLEAGVEDFGDPCPDYVLFNLSSHILDWFKNKDKKDLTLNVLDSVKLGWDTFGLGCSPNIESASLMRMFVNDTFEWCLVIKVSSLNENFVITTPMFTKDVLLQGIERDEFKELAPDKSWFSWDNFLVVTQLQEDCLSFFDGIACFVCNEQQFDRWQDSSLKNKV